MFGVIIYEAWAQHGIWAMRGLANSEVVAHGPDSWNDVFSGRLNAQSESSRLMTVTRRGWREVRLSFNELSTFSKYARILG